LSKKTITLFQGISIIYLVASAGAAAVVSTGAAAVVSTGAAAVVSTGATVVVSTGVSSVLVSPPPQATREAAMNAIAKNFFMLF
jgi:hypothetical protein